MPQDAYTIKHIVKELSPIITGGKITKITQPDKDTLLLFLYTAEGTVKLEICLSARTSRISIADKDAPAMQVAPNFCMLLRKHLTSAQILSVAAVENERVVYFDLDCVSEFERTKMRLYCELMGKYSNAVLTRDGIIVGALKTTSLDENVKRLLFTGAKYSLPEPQDKIPPDDLAALIEAFKNAAGDRAKFISDTVKGVAYSTALDIVEFYGENAGAKDVNSYICGGVTAPCVTFSDGEPSDFKVRSAAKDKKNYDSVLSAQTAYYSYILAKKTFSDSKRRLTAALSSAVKKVEKRLANINQKLLECADMETVKLKGELITANIYAVKRGMDSFEAVNYYDENCGKIKIALDKTLSSADNAQRYYKKYAKLKRTALTVGEQKREAEAELDYLNSINSHIYAAESVCDLEEIEQELKDLHLLKDMQTGKKRAAPSPFRSYKIGGFKVIAGRNNIQNDRLLKSVSSQDIWLHTQNYHSSHVAIITEGKAVPDGVLLAAAEICAYYSDGRGGSKVPVDYTLKKFVKKPPKANAGFVIYTDYKTVLAEPCPHSELKEE